MMLCPADILGKISLFLVVIYKVCWNFMENWEKSIRQEWTGPNYKIGFFIIWGTNDGDRDEPKEGYRDATLGIHFPASNEECGVRSAAVLFFRSKATELGIALSGSVYLKGIYTVFKFPLLL